MQEKSPIQKIIFGSPGTGKSYKIDKEILFPILGIDSKSENCIKTVFHPEYTYGDFMGKLLPLSEGGKVEYHYYEGHFLKALAQAYKNILNNEDKPENVVLVIDELNRGNSSAIFGTIFQLLDRDENGWSSYEITISEMERKKLLKLIGLEDDSTYNKGGTVIKVKYKFNNQTITEGSVYDLISRQKIKIPSNLSIIATINTSDTSIYYMDSAFKRRWEWEFLDVINSRDKAENRKLYDEKTNWVDFVDKLNKFIKDEYKSIRKIEDKQIGYWFIRGNIISEEQIKNKLMFFIWDSVFSNNKKPLINLLKLKEENLVTFGDFTNQINNFIREILGVRV